MAVLISSRALGVRLLVSAAVVLGSSLLWLWVDDAGARAVRFGGATMLGDRGDRAGSQIQGVAVNAKGQAMAVWTRHHRVRVATRSPAGAWGRPVTVGRNRRIAFRSFQVAMNEHGDAVIGWMLDDAAGPPSIVVVTRTAGHRWSAPKTLSNAGQSAVGITGRGEAILAWVGSPRHDGRFAVLVAARRGGRWSRAVTLGVLPVNGVALDVHANGRAAAMWSTASGIMVSRRSRGGAWRPAETVWTPAQALPGVSPALDWRPLEVAVAGDGQVISAWSTGKNMLTTGVVEVVEYRPSAGWSAPRTLTTVVGLSLAVSLDMDDRGEAVIGWEHPDARNNAKVYAVTRTSSGAWSSERLLCAPAPRILATGPLVAITGRGRLFATWPIFDHDLGRDAGVEAATGSVSSGWRTRVTIARRRNGGGSSGPWLAAAGGSHAVIGWDQRTRDAQAPTAWASVTR